jgi:hypothetical protein
MPQTSNCNRLDDFENSCAAYEKSIELDQDYVTHLNYAITLLANDEVERATSQFGKYEMTVTKVLQADVDPDVMRQAELVRLALGET